MEYSLAPLNGELDKRHEKHAKNRKNEEDACSTMKEIMGIHGEASSSW